MMQLYLVKLGKFGGLLTSISPELMLLSCVHQVSIGIGLVHLRSLEGSTIRLCFATTR